ncbi:DUF1365 domain-containing protein [Thalassobaculum fulvum]|uniref:DUF1365 domain-containing protein n=1 Tax=Thalassobaculum fulvum TaxID=1633335 RepID=A0A919CP11_9PROT|nr:DUF1365 domain-containing protein [Thalassobaculum fulvum]GHD40474.1 DUF1365 domain-containing protein [Thalassobaculum fulvum]
MAGFPDGRPLDNGPLRSALYVGHVMHARPGAHRHRFRYRVVSLLLDLDELELLDRRLASFSVERPNLFSFRNRDHGPRDGSDLRPWVEAAFDRAGRPLAGGRIQALCFPRVLGYVFNPLTIYWGYDPAGRLAGVLYEVKNTFGDQHGYVIPAAPDHRPGTPLIQGVDKRFHVSPFLPLEGGYRFRLDEPGERLRVLIRLVGPDGADRLVATQTGARRELTDTSLLAGLATHPWVTAKVMAGIHWEALRLWLKGAPFHSRPEPPANPVSLGRDLTPATVRPEMP